MDEDAVEIENGENVCRLCLSTDEPRSSVFEETDEREDTDVSLATKIQGCLSIQISTVDKLSTVICANCVKNVNQWHMYKKSCLRSQNILNNWLKSQLQSNTADVAIKDEPISFESDDKIEIISKPTQDLELPYSSVQEIEEGDKTNDEQIEEVAVENINADDTDDVNEEKDPETDPQEVAEEEEGQEQEQEEEEEEEEQEVDKDEEQTEDAQEDCEPLREIKSEPQDDYDTDCTIEIDSANGSELLLNPMAVAAKDDIIMEADSTQKSNAAGAMKKKLRRGPHTHFRGTRVFKQKCAHCQIFLHSKHSYMNHMKRFHNGKDDDLENSELMSQNDDEEMVEDLEDELISMEKDSPLTQVQQEIISQLKTFSCYACEQTFNDRRSTLAHIRQHLPDLRPYTCVACLTEFPDRSLYQLHCGASFECAMKIALVVPKYGSERYFTCNMCLRPMQGRKELLSHLSKHSDKQYEEMMSPARAPPKLKPMAPLSTGKNNAATGKAAQVACGPYNNGDPAHNHKCEMCGMIYKHLPNLVRHKQTCAELQPEQRISYKCVHCSMTFLVFKKFHYHITADHKKKEFTCWICSAKFRSPSDFLTHDEKHRQTHDSRQAQREDGKKISQNAQSSSFKGRNASFPGADADSLARMKAESFIYKCSLCSQEFATRTELTEHRNLHLKVKIYSCAICRSMFSSVGALEVHMKDHGIEDPNERDANISFVEYGSLDEDVKIDGDRSPPLNASVASDPGAQSYECDECGKIMNSSANLRRHASIAHRNSKGYDCSECKIVFKAKEEYEQHMQAKHKSSKIMHQCPECPKSFAFPSNFKFHFRTTHVAKSGYGYGCDICGKVFLEEPSLKIHKGWHNRANSRLSTRFILGNQKSPSTADAPKNSSVTAELDGNSTERPARARKSFPNPPLQSVMKSLGNFQCQVCNDRFNDVTELRNHLWDVHCAKNKPEKTFSNNELQCELCMNVFPDQEMLSAHMRWHKANPILSDIRKTFPCDVCGKVYSSKKVLWKHKRLHKAASIKFQSNSGQLARKSMTSQFLCTICRKAFSSNQSLQRHKFNFHNDLNPQRNQQLYSSSTRRLSLDDEPKSKRPKFEDEDNPPKLPPFAMDFAGERKKPVMCHLCMKMFPNMSVLYKHKQSIHKPRLDKDGAPECIPMSTDDGRFSCNLCAKKFPGLSNLRQHFTIKHKKTFMSPSTAMATSTPTSTSTSIPIPMSTSKYQCTVSSCDLVFSTSDLLKIHQQTHTNMMFSCKLCDRYMFDRDSMMDHVINVHNTVYQADSRAFHREIDLNTYVVRGANGTMCPRCHVKYPNNRAMKIHYIKIHENAD